MIRRTAGRKKEPSMVTRGVRLLSVVILFLMATGCHSIHSRSVRDLIQLEGTKIDAAQTNIDLFQKETEARIKFLEQARSSLHESFKSLQIQETKHRFALASFRNLTTKKGDAAYAAAYQAFVDRVRAAETPLGGGTALTEAVARYLFKLMAYKDEYEVARLHTDKAFTDKIDALFEGDYKIVHHMAPPLLAKRNEKGELVKQSFGPWMRRALGAIAGLKGLRGSALDLFGKTAERQMERALIQEYRACIEELLAGLTPERLALAAEIARIPEDIRGYGHVKERHLKAARAKWDGLMAQWRSPSQRQAA